MSYQRINNFLISICHEFNFDRYDGNTANIKKILTEFANRYDRFPVTIYQFYFDDLFTGMNNATYRQAFRGWCNQDNNINNTEHQPGPHGCGYSVTIFKQIQPEIDEFAEVYLQLLENFEITRFNTDIIILLILTLQSQIHSDKFPIRIIQGSMNNAFEQRVVRFDKNKYAPIYRQAFSRLANCDNLIFSVTEGEHGQGQILTINSKYSDNNSALTTIFKFYSN